MCSSNDIQSFEVISVPAIGDSYYFFDNDIIKTEKRYSAIVTDVIRFENAESWLIHEWNENKKYGFGRYAEQTDCFVVCKIDDYDDDLIYFVRDIHGAFYSIETTSEWQLGRLDITGEYNEALQNGYTKTKWSLSEPDYLTLNI